MNKFLTMYGVSAEIDTAENGATTENWAVLGEGIENLAEALNEVVYSGFYLHNGGYGNSEVTGMQPVVTMSPVTIANIQELSGNTQDGSAISFELRFNGKPEITTGSKE